MHLGKGMVGAVLLNSGGANQVAITTTTVNLTTENLLNGAATGLSYADTTNFVREIRSPAGGVMQFKGLT